MFDLNLRNSVNTNRLFFKKVFAFIKRHLIYYIIFIIFNIYNKRLFFIVCVEWSDAVLSHIRYNVYRQDINIVYTFISKI